MEPVHHAASARAAGWLLPSTSVLPDRPPRVAPAACIPTAQILALVTTLAIHPTLNTRSNDPTLQAASDLAVFYLRDCIRSFGIDSTIAEAWTFRAERKQAEGAAYTHRRENKRQKIKREEEQRQSDQAVGFADSASISSSEEAQIKSPLSGDGSLFGRVDDFAALFGWALNCSMRHKKRWARYKLLLTIILDAIDQDWRDRSLQSSDHHDTLRQSLLARLICTDGFQSRTPKRRLLRSILADGSHKSIQEFPEIWKGETKPPKKTGLESRIANRDEERKKRKVMDVDAGEFGDYDDPDDEDDLDLHALDGQDDRRRSARRKKSTQQSHAGQDMQLDDPPETTDALEAFGGFDSMVIRKRILVLVSLLGICNECRPRSNLNSSQRSRSIFRIISHHLRIFSTSLQNHSVHYLYRSSWPSALMYLELLRSLQSRKAVYVKCSFDL